MKQSYYQSCLDTLKELNEDYPDVEITRHISTAVSEQDIEGLTDKEFFKSLRKYQNELAIDGNKEPFDKFVNKIIEDGKHLFDEEDEYGDF